MNDTKKTLAQRLVVAMRSIDAVTKRGTNDRQKYSYVKAADVANEVRKVLCDEGIAFTYSADDTDRWEKATNGGGTLFFCEVKATFRFIDQDSGETLEVKGVGWGADSLDKAPYKAMTGALKYALRMNFLIPDEEDPEKGNELYDDRPTAAGSHVVGAPIKFVTKQAHTTPATTPAFSEDADPLFDENGDIIESKATVQHREQKQIVPAIAFEPASGKPVNVAQGKRFVAIALGNGRDWKQIGVIFKQMGIEKADQIPYNQYDNAIKWAGGKNERLA